MVNKVRTLDFLPEIFRTHTNRQFLNASLDLLVDQPDLKRVQGFIGEKYGYGIEPTDKYVVEPTKTRSDYQLDPGVIFLKKDTQTAQDFINYSGIINALRNEGADVKDHDRLWNNTFYSWDPFIDYDKIANYSQYYWIPNGPDAVPVYNTIVYSELDFTVTGDDGGYIFTTPSGKNPILTLLRGGTYQFIVPSGSTNFWIQTVPGVDATPAERTITGVTNNGTDDGVIEFVVPSTVTLAITTLYYQSGSDPNSVGVINLVESNSSNPLDVSQITGRRTYTSPNGIKFTNGLKIKFDTNAVPASYQNGEYYVGGVGSSIDLLPVTNFLAAEISGEVIYNLWDYNPWDVEVWGEQLYVPFTPEYITISRESRDYNAWTRANRWFHQDVLDTTQEALGYVTIFTSNTVTRAQRPIVEFRGNLKLFNSGVSFLGFINLLDTSTTDAFSNIQGKTLVEVGLINGMQISDGLRIVFAGDTNPLVRQNVYIIQLISYLEPGSSFPTSIINLVPDTTAVVQNNSQVVVYYEAGITYGGTTWWFNAATSRWNQGQKKTLLNQAPLYDIFNNEGYSLSDESYYVSNTFNGTKLFSYTTGDGPNDPVLGFPIAYSSLESIGDILFTVNLNNDVFSYSVGEDQITKNINIGFVHHYLNDTTYENLSGWVEAAGESFQYQVFEFPVIEALNYSADNTTVSITIGGSGYMPGDIVKISGSNLGGTSPDNDLYFTISAVSSGTITGIDTSTFNGQSVAVNDVFTNLNITAVTGVGTSAIASVVISGTGTTEFTCDVLAKTNPLETQWNPVLVYYNDNILDTTQYTVTRNSLSRETTIKVQSAIGVKITALLISSDVSKTAYYQTPSNLENNPFNTNITSVAVGDLKNQYRTIFSNAPGTVGQIFGDNNFHDLGNINKYGLAIIQNSASLVLPGLFLRKQEVNLFNSIQFNSDQYGIYKQLIVDLAVSSDYNVNTPASDILDDIIYQISTTKTQESPFFWSDMVYSGNPYITNTYNLGSDTTSATFSLSPEIWTDDMYSQANYRSVAIYLIRSNSTTKTSATLQLVRGIDYTVSTTPGVPSVTVNYQILAGDSIIVKEYNQTYGSYCPNTPSKLGIYPIFIPAVVQPPNTTNHYILGHDGSLNKLWGNYTLDVGLDIYVFSDFRDKVLYEFETRIFNNFKVSGNIPLQGDDIIPGQWRQTEYTWEEILGIYSTEFLNWVGVNRLDYKTQFYRVNNKFTYNYNQSTNKLDGGLIQQGYWKGLYEWVYDTANPAGAPWEMLGLVTKPTWWNDRYGPAPYTSGNTYMWEEIAAGYVWNDGNPYINTKRIRPELLSVLPVDSWGNLVNPFISVVGNYNNLTFNTDWRVGDGAPVEYAYRTSSTWPFDFARLLALTKPAKFFNLFADLDDYKFNSTILTPGQYLFNERYHLDPRELVVYGSGVAKHSYINWIVDYNYQRGANGRNVVNDLLKNLDVRLVYSIAGFSAKNYLKFLVEKATPNSRNSSLLIPDENYAVLLYDNPPEEKIIYSSVIIQKLANGWAVWGNSKNKNYFTTDIPKPSNFKKITVRGVTVQIAEDFYTTTQTIPYGTIYYSQQAISQFLINYGAYLQTQGVVFDNIINGVVYDWSRIVEEFLSWSTEGWEIGSVISLNPNARTFTVDKPGLVPQPLTAGGENFILNQNLLPIDGADLCINRENTSMELEILSPTDTIAYSNINLSSIEHTVVFDNYTSFGDTIYNLQTGLRQQRLLLQGYKTAGWSGYINTSGFILNENNIKQWQPNTKYPKNIIVEFKNKYYTAVKLIEPAAEFSVEDWLETDYGQIKTGLLPNPSTEAYESLYYYDTTRANLENDADLLSFSLIGFRPRDYMAAADLSDITQINVYKNIIKTKGTKQLADSFRGAKFNQGEIDYIIQENWAIKGGDFGSILNTNYVEARLVQAELTGNPTIVGFAPPAGTVAGVQQSIAINDLINWERPPLTENFLPPKQGSYTLETGIPPAGYANLGDSKFQAYTFEDLNDDSTIIETLYRGDIVWLANHNNSWDIFAAESLDNEITSAQNNLNSTVTLVFANIHRLAVDDLVCITNFDSRINGFYKVKSVPTIYTITVDLILESTVNIVTSSGTGFKLVSRRYEQASNSAGYVIPYSEWSQKKIWVDYSANSQWAVWNNTQSYKQVWSVEEAVGFGQSVSHTTELGILSIDGLGNLYRYVDGVLYETLTGGPTGAGAQIIAIETTVFCTSPGDGLIYKYVLDELTNTLIADGTITPALLNVSGAITISRDLNWLYVADAINQQIELYLRDQLTGVYNLINTLVDPAVPASVGWGTSIATSTDGVKLVVGAPYQDSGIIVEAGAAYIYTRRVQRFYGDGITTAFTLFDSAPADSGIVYVDDILIVPPAGTATITGTTVDVFVTDPEDPLMTIPSPDGSVVTISTGFIEFVQRVDTEEPHLRGWYGISVDTNRYGAEVVVGSPYELLSQPGNKQVEGAVYRYTNSGQRYGVVTTTIIGSKTGTIFIDGYQVDYNGSITDIRDAINIQTPTNVYAYVNGASTLVITVRDDTPEVLFNIIDITGPTANLADLGIIPYTRTQVVYNHNGSNTGAFGYNVAMDERDSLLAAAINDVYVNPTTFDYTGDCVENDTIFDGDTTIWIDRFTQCGVVYLYDYLPAYNESITNSGKYAFGQYISSASITPGTPSPKFGWSMFYGGGKILVGTPWWTTTVGGIAEYTVDWVPQYECSAPKSAAWTIDKVPLPVVDIDAVSNISIYNTVNNQTLEWLDYIDPLQGKILGAVATNIDFMDSVDPAVYASAGVSWTWDHIGQTWLDLTTIRMLNYHQPDYHYNAKNWGKAFPGSTADIYTWIESVTPPISYVGSGFPINFDQYTTATMMDNSTNNLVTKYYFWVKNYGEVPSGKTLSPLVCSAYLLNPLTSGISYFTPITTNVVGLYNSGEYIRSDDSALHVGYGVPGTLDEKHTSWNLIRDGDPEDFLTGLPTILGNQPSGLYLKFIESFSGFDADLNIVPDPRLPALARYGTLFRPRQSMFINRNLALRNYITYANNLLIRLPIAEMRQLSFLLDNGLTYDTRNYWRYVNWWADGYNDEVKPVLEVNNVNDLQIITENQVLISIGGTNVQLEDGLIVKVKANRYGKSEYYVYGATSNPRWSRIGAENTTIQLSPALYGLYGWASELWGGVWDKNPSQEIVNVIRWLNEQCYIDDLSIERNRSLVLMFKFIQSESLQDNNYLPWLNKTSLTDVNHKIRDLLPYKKYQRDNQEFLEGFLNEIKPYHVVIKDFIFSYTGEDLWAGSATDFDLPAEWNASLGRFVTPALAQPGTNTGPNQYTPSNIIWQNGEYKEWFANTGLTINNSEDTNYQLSTLTAILSASAVTASVKDVTGFPIIGIIKLGLEEISYNSIDPVNNLLLGLTRGVNDTVAAVHPSGSAVLMDLPAVLIYNSGRGYSEPPKITAYIDENLWGQPRTPANLDPTMAADRLIGVDVLAGGDGYFVTPQLLIPGSSIQSTYSNSSYNLIDNTITILGHNFNDGESVVLSGTGNIPVGLTVGNQYYVGVIDSSTISLYSTYASSLLKNTVYTSTSISSISRVATIVTVITVGAHNLATGATVNISGVLPILFNGLFTSITVVDPTTFTYSQVAPDSTGIVTFGLVQCLSPYIHTSDSDGRVELIAQVGLPSGSSTLAVSAKAVCITNGRPVREIRTKIKFDRVTYNYTPAWVSGEYYSGASPSIPTPTPDPTRIEFVISTVVGPSIPDVATVEFLPYSPAINPAQLTGQKLKFDDGAGVIRWYWVKTVNDTTVELYNDPWWLDPVPTAGFLFGTGNSVYLPLPTAINTDFVTVNGVLYKCVEANNDTIFDPIKWVEVEPTAADRILQWYEPTLSMPGKDLAQLMVGVEYANAIFLALELSNGWEYGGWSILPWDFSNLPVETELSGGDFTGSGSPDNYPYVVEGDPFADGYTPEELVGGWVIDSIVITITTAATMFTPQWIHTITISKTGVMNVLTDTGLSTEAFDLQYNNNLWWYGTPGLNPVTDPLANTTLTDNTNPYAVFLRS